MINKTIGRYKITTLIGKGGMATVYLAHDNKFDTNVAIKVLNKEYVHNDNIRKRFIAEARNMFKMSHPNIIKVTDLIDEGDTVAFVMEHIEGETLKEYIERKGKLSDDEIKNFFSQMLEAVGYIHEQNLVHRDIKPSNFMITPKGQIKLLDFGIAKNLNKTSIEYTITEQHQIMGTVMYMSPEQVKSTKDVTLQSDIYSLGVVLWQMVMGKKPYHSHTTSTFDLQTKIVNEKLLSTSSIFDLIIEKSTAKDLEGRFKNCEEVKNNIENLQKLDNESTKAFTSQNSEKTIIETAAEKTIVEKNEQTDFQKLIVDQFFPAKVKSHFHKLYFELGLDIYSDIIDPISLETSHEYDLIHFEGLEADFGCFSFEINKIEFLLGVYMNKWCLIFNNHHYLYFKEIKQLNRINDLILSDNIVALIIDMVNRFTSSEYCNKLADYIIFKAEERAENLKTELSSLKNENSKVENIPFDITIFNQLINKYQIQKASKLFLYPEINEKKGANFIIKFQYLLIPTIKEYTFLLLHDDTLFGKCDEGFAILLGDEGKLFILISEDKKPLHISTINFDHYIFPRINDINVKGVFNTGVEVILNNSNTISYYTQVGNTSSNFEKFAKHLIHVFNAHES